MPRPGSPAASPAVPSPPTLAPGERLQQVARALDAALAQSPPGHPMALFLRAPEPGGDEAELGWLDLGGRDPVEALLGFTAPPDWQAVGFAGSGRATTLCPDEPVPRAPHRPHPEPVRVVAFVDREGRSVTVLRRGTGCEVLDEAPEGLLGDCLRRALGLPTAPPAPPAHFWVSWWLDRVVAMLVGGPGPGSRRSRRRGWPAVAALHPAAAPAPGGRVEPSELVAATRHLAERWPWARLRTECPPGGDAAPAGSPPGPPPDVAGWMDDGMFARWCLGPLPELLETCRQLLAAEAWACLAATVTATIGPLGDASAEREREASADEDTSADDNAWAERDASADGDDGNGDRGGDAGGCAR